jgi:hypothetical protein
MQIRPEIILGDKTITVPPGCLGGLLAGVLKNPPYRIGKPKPPTAPDMGHAFDNLTF